MHDGNEHTAASEPSLASIGHLSRRRFLYLLGSLSAVPAITALSGCTNNHSSSGALGAGAGASKGGKVTSLVVATNTSPWLTAYQAVASEYEKQHGVHVTLRQFPYAGLETQMTNAIQQKTMAFDVFQLDEPWTAQFYDSGWAMPLTDINPNYKLDPGINTFDGLPFWDKSKRISAPSGELFGVPVNGNTHLFVYRKDIYDALGLSVPTTWDDAVANGKKAQAAGKIKYGYAIRAKDGPTHDFCNVFDAYGADWFANPGVDWTPTVTTSQAVAATQMYKQLADLGPNPATVDQATVVSLVQGGQVLQTHLVATTAAQLLDPSKSQVADKLAFHELPAGPAGKPTPVSGTWSLCVPTGLPANRAAAALDFITYVASKTGQQTLLANGTGGIPVRDDVLNVPGLPATTEEYLSAYATSLKDIKPLYRFFFNGSFTQQTEKDLSDILDGQVSVQAGLASLQQGLAGVVKAAGLSTK